MLFATALLSSLSLASASIGSDPPVVEYLVTAAAVDTEGLSSLLRVTITLPGDDASSRATLIMPRAIPMGYGQQPYDEFVRVKAVHSRSGALATVTRDDGPRWSLASTKPQDPIASVDYEVDLVAMEAAILPGGDSSRARSQFMSLLGYSVFPFVEGLEGRAIDLTIRPPGPDWPVFSTLAPVAPPVPGPLKTRARDFYSLADSQILMGRGFSVQKLQGAPSLFMTVHAEEPAATDVMAPLAEQAFEALIRYYGSAPFSHFTLLFDYLKPVSPRHRYGFSMEHLESATFGAPSSAVLTMRSGEDERSRWRYNVAHHIAHAWIPKRCAGEGYFPFRFELAPLIDTIWLSEGFSQYAAADALSDLLPPRRDGTTYREAVVEARFRSALREMPDFLKRLPLVELSRIASTVYSEDFRTGRTVFSRGGLIAYEMDETIRKSTRGGKRLRDALRGLVAWSAREQRAFRIDELSAIFELAVGVDTHEILDRGLAGLK